MYRKACTGGIRWWNLGVINWISLGAVDNAGDWCNALLSGLFMHRKIHLKINRPRRNPTKIEFASTCQRFFLPAASYRFWLIRLSLASLAEGKLSGTWCDAIMTAQFQPAFSADSDEKLTRYRQLNTRHLKSHFTRLRTWHINTSRLSLIAKYLHFWRRPDKMNYFGLFSLSEKPPQKVNFVVDVT